MNKSKLLKKSLAMVLAVLMIVAMIPLGASAASVISRIIVDNAEATGSGTAWAVDVSSTATASPLKVDVVLANDKGMVYYNVGNGLQQATHNPSGELGVWEISGINYGALSGGKLPITTFDADGSNPVDVVLTLTRVNADTDATIKTFTVPDQYGDTLIDNIKNTITITVPYDYPTAGKAPTIRLNSAKAQGHDFTGNVTATTAATTETQQITVTAESGGQKTYKIIVNRAPAFKSFSVEGERKEAKIDVANKTITVYMPYDTSAAADGNFYFIPKFDNGYASVKITCDGKAVKSGETKINYGTAMAISNNTTASVAAPTTPNKTFSLTYTNSVTENWTVIYSKPQLDLAPVIKGLTVSNYAAEIDEASHTINLEIPYVLRDNVANNVTISASDGTKIEVVKTNTTASVVSGSKVQTQIDLTKSMYTLRVTAAGYNDATPAAKDVQDYVLNITTGDAGQAKINAMTLQDPDGENYEALSIDQNTNTITLQVPFAKKAPADLTNWKIFYQMSNGSTLQVATKAAADPETPGDWKDFPAKGAVIDTADCAYLPTTFDNKTTGWEVRVVTDVADAASGKVYKIKVKRNAAEQGVELVSLNVIANIGDAATGSQSIITDTTTYKAVPSGVNLTASIPYSQYPRFQKPFVTTELSKNATLWYVDKNSKLQKVTPITEGTDGNCLPKVDGTETVNKYNGVIETGKTDPNRLTLVVLSEEGADGVTAGAAYDPDFKAKHYGKFREYTLAVKQMDWRYTALITGISVVNAATGESTAKVVPNGNDITLTVPYHFAEQFTSNPPELYLDITVAGGESVYTGTSAVAGNLLTPYEVDADGNVLTGCSNVEINKGTDRADGNFDGAINVASAAAFKAIHVVSEATGKQQTTNDYNVFVIVEAPKQACEMNSVTINNVTARPNDKQTATINLPYGSEVTHLKPSFSVSQYATVQYYDATNGWTAVPEGRAFNFTFPITFRVLSEDEKNYIDYSVVVTTADQFVDVKEGAWYYKDVMDAVAAGVVFGYGDGRFGPGDSVTRGQFAQFIARMDGYNAEEYKTKDCPFSDVTAGTEQAAAITYCAEKNYIAGTGGTNYAPNVRINREQMAVIVAQVMGLTPVTTPKDKFADDASISGWAKSYVYAAFENGILAGTGNNRYTPKGTTTRAEAASVAMRISRAK